MASKRSSLEFDEYEHKASDVIHFKLIRHAGDITSPDLVFHPTFTHQFFPSETISGFRDLCINIYFVASSLFCYLKYEYSKERAKLKCTDLGVLTEGLPGGFTDDIEVFSKHIGEEFEPPGKKVYSYVVNGADYEIFLGDFRDPELQAYHQRLQYFLLFFIDRSSFIDDADPIWEILLVFEKVRDSVTGVCQYYIVGYTTLYKFLYFPDKWRLRVSQLIILPPFQRSGHGARLLQHVHKMAVERNYAEVNVEDPSVGFQFVRDCVDLTNCRKAGAYQHVCLDENVIFSSKFFSPSKKRARIKKEGEAAAAAANANLSSSNTNTNSNVSNATTTITTTTTTTTAITTTTSSSGNSNSSSGGSARVCVACLWDEKHAQQVQSQLRITRAQARKMYEIHKFATLRNEEDYKSFRLDVKQRLYAAHAEQLLTGSADAEERKQKLARLYEKQEERMIALIKKANISIPQDSPWLKNLNFSSSSSSSTERN